MKTDWRTVLGRIVELEPPDDYPFVVFGAEPPATYVWPSSIPCPRELHEFWAICGGGYFAHENWLGADQAVAAARQWEARLSDYDARGAVLDCGRHLVFAIDSGGCPVIWDSHTDLVASFFFKGGDWEPTGLTMEQYLQATFVTPAATDDWLEYLAFYREPA